MLLLKMKCHLDLPLRCEKVTAREGERKREETWKVDQREKVDKMNRQSKSENLRGRQRETERE